MKYSGSICQEDIDKAQKEFIELKEASPTAHLLISCCCVVAQFCKRIGFSNPNIGHGSGHVMEGFIKLEDPSRITKLASKDWQRSLGAFISIELTK